MTITIFVCVMRFELSSRAAQRDLNPAPCGDISRINPLFLHAWFYLYSLPAHEISRYETIARGS